MSIDALVLLTLAVAACGGPPAPAASVAHYSDDLSAGTTAEALTNDLTGRGYMVQSLVCADVAYARQRCDGVSSVGPLHWNVAIDRATHTRRAVLTP